MGDNIRMDIKEMVINTKNLVDSAQNRDAWRALLNAALNLRVLELVNNYYHINKDTISNYFSDFKPYFFHILS